MSAAASPKTETAKTAKTPVKDTRPRKEQAQDVIRRDVLWALGAGLVPVPLGDIAAVTAVEMKMLRELSQIYDVTFTENIARKIAYTLLSSIGAVGIGAAIGGSLTKLIPVVGSTLGMISVPAVAAAFTHALGQVLVVHFEVGGTLLDFDAEAMRAHFKSEFEKANQTVAQMQTETARPSAKPV